MEVKKTSRFARLVQEEIKEVKELKELKEMPEIEDIKEMPEEGLDYSTYKLSHGERIKYLLLSALGIFVVGYIFYRSIIICLIICPLSLLFLRQISKDLCKKRKKDLAKEFNEGIYLVYTALSAGKSLEQSFHVAFMEMDKNQFPLLYGEFRRIVHKIDINENVEKVMTEFAERTGIDDIQDFADILVTSKRTEGDIIKIIKRTMNLMGEKADITREIENNIAQKKLEQKILMGMPVFMILFLGVTSKGYLDPLYNTLGGRVAMTLALIVMVICYGIANKITDIKI